MEERFSLGLQTFSRLIRERRIYVDKTDLIYQLVKEGNGVAYFFSRPRRFGKSLLISTLKSIFEGKQDLFKELYIYDKIEWVEFPIIHISMSDMDFVKWGLEKSLWMTIKDVALGYGIEMREEDAKAPLTALVKHLFDKFQKEVVILIDEYDKPITHGLESNNTDLAVENRDIMKRFYAGLKDADAYIRFLFVTGIAKFTKVSIFSDLNHLKDISLDDRFATLCGYTQAEVTHYFPQSLTRLYEKQKLSPEKCWEKIQNWYNGFSWDGVHFVYNPFSTLNLLDSGQFFNYWFTSGTPTFLVKMLNDKFTYKLENMYVTNRSFDIFDLRNLDTTSILLQTGYLTIKERLEEDYLVGFPNKEVRESFNEMLIADYLNERPGETGITIFHIRRAFVANDLLLVMNIIKTLFESVPYQLFEKKDRNGNIKPVGENFYHAIIYLIFNTLGVKMQAEVAVKEGRIDAVVETSEHIYLFEFKKDESPEIAINQMQEKGYAKKYSLVKKKVHLIGASFSLETRGLTDWKEKIV